MKIITFTYIGLLCGFTLGAQEFQLAPPQVNYASPFFESGTSVNMAFALEGAEIRYTLDGTDPGPQSPVYAGPLVLKESCVLKAATFHTSYRPSEPVAFRFFKQPMVERPDSFWLEQAPAARYTGKGALSLIDKVKGSANFGDGNWLGFEGKTLALHLFWNKKTKMKGLIISRLNDAGAWIFPPVQISVRGSTDGRSFITLLQKKLKTPDEGSPLLSGQQYDELHWPARKLRYLEVLIEPLQALPSWHQGKGAPAWLFVDEILIR